MSECAVWLWWVLSVLVGAVAVAVMLYVSTMAGYALYEATHDSWFEFVVEVGPWLWLLLFILMAGAAYYNVRCTKKGYKYPFWSIIVSSLVLSVLGGVAFNYLGASGLIEKTLAEKMPMYRSFEKLERSWWLRPDDGLLIGTFLVNQPSSTQDNFIDIKSKK